MDVPEDIRETARKIAKVAIYNGGVDWAAEDIAQALLAERIAQRERDAEIAEEESAKWKGCGNARGDGYGDGARNATLKLAADIRHAPAP